MLNLKSNDTASNEPTTSSGLPVPDAGAFSDTSHAVESRRAESIPVPDFSIFSDENTPPQEEGLHFKETAELEMFRTTGHRVADKCGVDQTYRLYGLSNVRELIANVAAMPSAKNALRFLLSDTNELLFAREGKPMPSVIPPHYKLTGAPHGRAQCYSAGNLSFRIDGSIYRINHKSGDFRPSFDSLKWVLVLLLNSRLYDSFESTFEVQRLTERGGIAARYEVNKAELRTQVNDVVGDRRVASLLRLNQKHTGRTVEYSAAFPGMLKRRALSLGATKSDHSAEGLGSQTPARSKGSRLSYVDRRTRSEFVRRRGRTRSSELLSSVRTLFADNAVDASAGASQPFLKGDERPPVGQLQAGALRAMPAGRVLNALFASGDEDTSTQEQTPSP